MLYNDRLGMAPLGNYSMEDEEEDRFLRAPRSFHPRIMNSEFQPDTGVLPTSTSSIHRFERFRSGFPMRGAFSGVGQLPSTVSYEKAQREALAFIGQVKVWAEVQGQNLDGWAAALATKHTLGALGCDEMKAYNNAALAYWGLLNEIYQKARENIPGKPNLPDYPPSPTLFAHSTNIAVTGGVATHINVNLTCLSDGRPAPGLYIGPACPPAACALPAQLTAVEPGTWIAFVASGLAIIGTYLLLPKVDMLIDSFTGADVADMKERMDARNFQRQKLRAKDSNACAAREIDRINLQVDDPQYAEKIKAIYAVCDASAARKYPEGEPLGEPKNFLVQLIKPAAIIVGLFLGLRWLERREIRQYAAREAGVPTTSVRGFRRALLLR
jgi:hypothetical protein